MEEAGGVGKNITKEFDVDVDDGTLEIHLYWAGKGTTAIPDRGVYGPLISAIEMIPSKCYYYFFFQLPCYFMFYKHFFFVLDFENPSKGMSTGFIVGIVAASCGLVILILVLLWKMGFICKKDTTDKGSKTEIQNKSA